MTNPIRPRVLVLDWHGVLDHITFAGVVQRLANLSGLTTDKVRKRIEYNERRWIIGARLDYEFWGVVGLTLGLSPRQYQAVQDYILSVDLDRRLLEFVRQLRKEGLTLHLLSDTPLSKVGLIVHGVSPSPFHYAQFSSVIRMHKKDPRFFETHLRHTGVNAPECLYVDDNESNLVIPREMGYQVYHYQGFEAFREYIKERFPEFHL